MKSNRTIAILLAAVIGIFGSTASVSAQPGKKAVKRNGPGNAQPVASPTPTNNRPPSSGSSQNNRPPSSGSQSSEEYVDQKTRANQNKGSGNTRPPSSGQTDEELFKQAHEALIWVCTNLNNAKQTNSELKPAYEKSAAAANTIWMLLNKAGTFQGNGDLYAAQSPLWEQVRESYDKLNEAKTYVEKVQAPIDAYLPGIKSDINEALQNINQFAGAHPELVQPPQPAQAKRQVADPDKTVGDLVNRTAQATKTGGKGDGNRMNAASANNAAGKGKAKQKSANTLSKANRLGEGEDPFGVKGKKPAGNASTQKSAKNKITPSAKANSADNQGLQYPSDEEQVKGNARKSKHANQSEDKGKTKYANQPANEATEDKSKTKKSKKKQIREN